MGLLSTMEFASRVGPSRLCLTSLPRSRRRRRRGGRHLLPRSRWWSLRPAPGCRLPPWWRRAPPYWAGGGRCCATGPAMAGSVGRWSGPGVLARGPVRPSVGAGRRDGGLAAPRGSAGAGAAATGVLRLDDSAPPGEVGPAALMREMVKTGGASRTVYPCRGYGGRVEQRGREGGWGGRVAGTVGKLRLIVSRTERERDRERERKR